MGHQLADHLPAKRKESQTSLADYQDIKGLDRLEHSKKITLVLSFCICVSWLWSVLSVWKPKSKTENRSSFLVSFREVRRVICVELFCRKSKRWGDEKKGGMKVLATASSTTDKRAGHAYHDEVQHECGSYFFSKVVHFVVPHRSYSGGFIVFGLRSIAERSTRHVYLCVPHAQEHFGFSSATTPWPTIFIMLLDT